MSTQNNKPVASKPIYKTDELRIYSKSAFIMAVTCVVASSQEPLHPLHQQQVDDAVRDAIRNSIDDVGVASRSSGPRVTRTQETPFSDLGERMAAHDKLVQEQFDQCVAVWRQEINLAKRLRAGKKYEEAAQAAIDALNYCRQNLGSDSSFEISNLTLLGNIYNSQQNPTKAFKMHCEVLNIMLCEKSPDYIDIGDQCEAISNWANSYEWTEICSEYNLLAKKYWRAAFFSYHKSYLREKKQEKFDYAYLSRLCNNLSVSADRLGNQQAALSWAQEQKIWQKKSQQ